MEGGAAGRGRAVRVPRDGGLRGKPRCDKRAFRHFVISTLRGLFVCVSLNSPTGMNFLLGLRLTKYSLGSREC